MMTNDEIREAFTNILTNASHTIHTTRESLIDTVVTDLLALIDRERMAEIRREALNLWDSLYPYADAARARGLETLNVYDLNKMKNLLSLATLTDAEEPQTELEEKTNPLGATFGSIGACLGDALADIPKPKTNESTAIMRGVLGSFALDILTNNGRRMNQSIINEYVDEFDKVLTVIIKEALTKCQ